MPDTRLSILHTLSHRILTTKRYPQEQVYTSGMQLVSGRTRTYCRPGSEAGVLNATEASS